VLCENGRVALSIKFHDWTISVLKERIESVPDFTAKLNSLITSSSASEVEKENLPDVTTHMQLSPLGATKRGCRDTPQLKIKKLKCIENLMDGDIERHKIGYNAIIIIYLFFILYEVSNNDMTLIVLCKVKSHSYCLLLKNFHHVSLLT